MNVLVRDVDIDLLRQQLHYMSEMSCMDYCFQGSPLFGAHSAPEGLEGVRKTLERMLGSTITKCLPREHEEGYDDSQDPRVNGEL